MKRVLFLLIAMGFSFIVLAQGNTGGKEKDKQKDKTEQSVRKKKINQIKEMGKTSETERERVRIRKKKM